LILAYQFIAFAVEMRKTTYSMYTVRNQTDRLKIVILFVKEKVGCWQNLLYKHSIL